MLSVSVNPLLTAVGELVDTVLNRLRTFSTLESITTATARTPTPGIRLDPRSV